MNNNIQIFLGQMILHSQKEINVIVYIIGKKKTLIISTRQNVNKIWNFKIDVCVMFKMKYWINRMHCNIYSQQIR